MRKVRYFAPTDIGAAVQLLAEHGDKMTILAGGTDLLPKLDHCEIEPDVLMFIGGVGLDYIKEEGGDLVIGAATSTARLARDERVNAKAGALAEAARQSGSVAIRTSATIGGNLANGSPAADLAAPLLAMDAQVKLVGPKGERTLPIQDFFLGPRKTALKPDELIVEIRVPLPKGKTVFLKLGRRKAQTLSVASVAVQLVMDGGMCQDARIVLGAMAPTPLRCKQAESLLRGKTLDEALIAECSAAAVAESSPIDDQRATAWYRKNAAKPLVARALVQAAGI